jgi:hypothetical protein
MRRLTVELITAALVAACLVLPIALHFWGIL